MGPAMGSTGEGTVKSGIDAGIWWITAGWSSSEVEGRGGLIGW